MAVVVCRIADVACVAVVDGWMDVCRMAVVACVAVVGWSLLVWPSLLVWLLLCGC